jgi:hypothetical protein
MDPYPNTTCAWTQRLLVEHTITDASGVRQTTLATRPIDGEISYASGVVVCACGERLGVELDALWAGGQVVSGGVLDYPRLLCPQCQTIYDLAFVAVPRPPGSTP